MVVSSPFWPYRCRVNSRLASILREEVALSTARVPTGKRSLTRVFKPAHLVAARVNTDTDAPNGPTTGSSIVTLLIKYTYS